MPIDDSEFLERAEQYLKYEGIAEVHSIELVKESHSAFGNDLIALAEIEDEQESECWVIGGNSPMNMYPKSKFDTPQEAHQFHFGTIAMFLHRESEKGRHPEWVGYDAFICHASDDKKDFVTPLAEELDHRELRVWYDDFELTVGDSLRESIDRGLRKSAYGIVILSEAFFEKEWTQYELNGLVARENSGENVILPVWYKVGKGDIAEFSPPLADKVAVRADGGDVQEAADEIYEAIIENARRQMAKEKEETRSIE